MSNHQSAAHVSNPAAAVFTPRYPHFKSSMRKGLAHALLLAFGGALAMPALAVVNWTDTTGFWDVATNWSSNPLLPGAADDVTINVAGIQTVTVRSPNAFTINSLSMPGDDILALTGGALTVSNTFSNAANTNISGGTLTLNGVSSMGSLTQTFGQISGSGNLTITGAANITNGGHSGVGSTFVQGATTISGTGLKLDGGRVFQNGGTVTQTNANVDMNSRNVGAAEAGNGSVTNAAGGIWNSNATVGTSFILASNQGVGDTGAGATFTNLGTFNKQGAAITEVRTNFINNGSLNVQAGQLQFATGGALTHNGTISVAAGGVLDFASGNTVTQTINTASTTIAGTLQISGDNFVNFTQAHTIGGTGTLLQNFGQVTGANLTLGPSLAFNITDGGHSGAATTTVQGTTSITGTGLRLDGGRIFRNEGVVTQTNANVDMNSRRSGAAEAGNGSVTNAAGGIWNSNATVGTSFILASSQGAGDTGAGAVFTNQGTFNKQGAAITEVRTNFINNGLVDAQAGTLRFTTNGTQGAGTLQTSGGILQIQGASTRGRCGLRRSQSGGILQIQGASTTGNLFHNTSAANSLILGANNVTVGADYNNANFGIGNTFNRYANVSRTTGQILAAGDVAQTITGAGVTGGISATPVLTIGNVHVGATTLNYQVANTGTTGPAIRGALQTSVNGGNITDARLSGSGVTASNFGPIATGANSGNLNVTFTAGSAGALAPLSGQAVHIINNFDNVADQNLSIVLGAGAGAFNLAAGNATPTPVILANQRVGGSLSQVLTVSNTAPAGAFTEGLNASFGANTGTATNNAGSINLLAGGASNGSALSVGVDASSAGAKNGTVTLNYVSDGTGTSGLGLTNVGSQAINVSGNVYRLAQGAATPTPVNFGNRHVGDVASQVLTVQNTAANDSFSESLNASFGSNTGAATNNAGNINLLAAGSSNNSAMSVGIDTSTAGAKSGTVTLNYVSDGTGSSGLSAIAAGSQTINVSGNVYRLASANTLGAVNFGNVHVGDTVQQALSISNTAVNDGFSERLNASFGASSDARIITSGSITQLAAGSSNNSSMIVGLNTGAAGTVNGTQTINFASDGTGTSGLGITALASQTIGVSGDITTSGSVFRLASASPATPNPVNFGNVRIGTATDQVLSISNTAANDGFSEKLNASISSNGAPVTATGAFNLLGPQATDSTSLHVGIDTSSAGAKSGSATIALVSDGTGTSGLGQTSLASQTVNVSGNVYRLANGTLNTPSVNLAARVGDASPTAAISISNSSPDVFTEGLKASIGGTASPFTSSGSISNLAAQGTAASALQVGLNTATAGASSGTATVNFTSTGAGTTGAADVSVGSAVVNLVGKVYQQAVAQVNTTLVDFGIVHRGDAVAPVAVSVSNTAPVAGLNDVLQGSLGGASGPFSASGNLGAGVAAGATDSSSLSVGLNTGATGVFNGTATASLTSHNADMADLVVGGIPVVLSAQVNDFANADLRKIGGDGSLSRSGLQIVLDFGNVTQGSGSHSTSLEVFNNVAGLGDLLDGQFSFIDANDFLFSGFNSFADLAAGSHAGSLGVAFDAVNLGAFSDTIVLASLGHNASGFSGALQDVTLLVKANVTAGSTVPEPESLLLMAIGMAALIALRRRARMN